MLTTLLRPLDALVSWTASRTWAIRTVWAVTLGVWLYNVITWDGWLRLVAVVVVAIFAAAFARIESNRRYWERQSAWIGNAEERTERERRLREWLNTHSPEDVQTVADWMVRRGSRDDLDEAPQVVRDYARMIEETYR